MTTQLATLRAIAGGAQPELPQDWRIVTQASADALARRLQTGEAL